MKTILSWAMAAGVLAMTANAAPFCASPSEIKLLKAAVLEQALTSAALSCHLDAQFGRFVAAYHSGMAESDRALQAFFARRSTGETYEAYKARIAKELAARSLHDAGFCAEAARVFDIALKHERAAPPKLIDTGYEHCAKPAARPVLATVVPAALRPVKPAPVPVPTLSPVARKALALAERNPPPIPRPAVRLPAPMKLATAAPKPALPAKPVPAERIAPVSDNIEDDAPYRPGDPVPNAYQPGAVWVDEKQAPLVQGPDGRWYVVIGHHAHWTHD